MSDRTTESSGHDTHLNWGDEDWSDDASGSQSVRPDNYPDLNLCPNVYAEPQITETLFDDPHVVSDFDGMLSSFVEGWDQMDFSALDALYDAADKATTGLNGDFDLTGDLEASMLDLFGGEESLRGDRRRPPFKYEDSATFDPTVKSEDTSYNMRFKDIITDKSTTGYWPDRTDKKIFLVYRAGHQAIVVEDQNATSLGIVGIPNPSVPFVKSIKLELSYDEGYTRACRINEEAPMKGTCLAFSNLVHFSAICTIAMSQNKRTTVLEPLEGYDLDVDGSTFEITGMNYRKRRTKAHYIINKYSLFRMTHSRSPLHERLLDWSILEDRKDTSFLKNTFFDVGHSPYTDSVDRMHKVTPLVTYQTKRQLVYHFQRYIKELPVEGSFEFHREHHDLDRLRADINLSLKNSGFPTPFFFLPAPKGFDDNSLGISINTRPFKFVPPSGPTAFRSHSVDKPYDHYLLDSDDRMGCPKLRMEHMMDGIFGFLYKFKIFQAIYAESELFPKIVGKAGCFYSTYLHVGICWEQLRHNSLTYYVSFYQLWQPDSEAEVGIWAKGFSDGITFYQSPCLKINRGEIQFAAILPYKVVTKVTAALPYCSEGQKLDIVKRILQMSAVQRHSTWQTSKIAGDFRFITLCSLAGSGDPVALCVKGIRAAICKHVSFPNYYLVLKMLHFCQTWDREPLNHTPIFGLPVRFLAMEKDLPLGMYWHLRSESHHTNCVKKMLDSVAAEIADREESVTFYNNQATILEGIVENNGIDYDSFKNFMESVPKFPVYNHILFLALSYTASPELRESAGARQWPTNLSLNNLVTDHKMANVTFSDRFFTGCIIRDSTVAEGLSELFKTVDTPLSIHDFLLKQSFLKPKPNIYTLHAKDAKSGDREISQMMPYMRAAQFYSEAMNSIYSDSEASDLMSDPKKYSKVVKMFQPLLRRGAFSRSEDKSFFCGHMHPEFMSLSTLAIGIDTGSTALVSSAAFQRMDSSRYVVLPTQAKLDEVIQGIPFEVCTRMDRKKPVVTRGYRVFKHMQQGIRAYGGAVIHTTYIKGFSRIMSSLIPDVEKYAQATTSDDSTRVVRISADTIFDRSTVASEFLGKPVRFLNHCMMKDSIEKAQLNSRLCEFNNLVIGPSGAIPQLFSHADLVIQPLISHNIARDILDSTSLARSSIVWGDSPDLACAAMWSYNILLRQKWLLSEIEVDFLAAKGFFPATFEELVTGGSHMSEDTLQLLWDELSPETQTLCKEGQQDVLSALAKFNFKDTLGDKEKRKREKKINVPANLGFAVKTKFDQINASRIFKGKLSGKYVTQKPPGARRAVTAHFLDLLGKPMRPVIPEVYEQKSILTRPSVLVALVKPKKWHVMPQTQGGSTTLLDRIDMRQVLMSRFGHMIATHHPNLREEMAAGLPEKEFAEWYRKRIMMKHKEGVSFSSVFGYPLTTQRYDNRPTNARSFVLSGEPSPIPREYVGLTIKGISYTNVTICIVGDSTLRICEMDGALPAFGFSVSDVRCYFFYKPLGEDIRVCRMRRPKDTESYLACVDGPYRVIVQVQPDNNPLNLISLLDVGELQSTSSYLAGTMGTPDALLQYGLYIHSNHNHAARLMNRIFRKFKAERPLSLIRMFPQYPSFLNDVVVIDRMPTTLLIGSMSILKLRLRVPDYETQASDYVQIDLMGPYPKIVERLSFSKPQHKYEVFEDIDSD